MYVLPLGVELLTANLVSLFNKTWFYLYFVSKDVDFICICIWNFLIIGV